MRLDMKRVFIVGCPRSGTTLLQGMLASHPRVLSFPETHFFSMAYPRNRFKRFITWPALNLRGVLDGFLKEIGRTELRPIANIGLFDRRYELPFVKVMDRLTRDAGKDVWVEKTPRHLHFIDEIGQRVPRASFIHIVRDGRDVAASLYKASNDNPSRWNRKRARKGFTLRQCVERWNMDVSITSRFLGKPGHLLVLYSAIVEEPAVVAREICSFLGIDYTDEMMDTAGSYGSIVRPEEPWKMNNAMTIQKLASPFEKVLNEKEREFVKMSIRMPDFMGRGR
ncbi:MAG TPA: hypothetical protein DDW94_03385 [Deltaproteobacteria bacterium]|nr:MAG: hypothetical protein A2Z79_10080 [Deltaproteobacteria bacterium GWA2_55_82]OGQ63016.1 MAG: hypothetical protein A3I81_06890 [Deltaproteobacteria bacterium RIFCSPLOWO2_02_FULL_55_12]OIJ72980.1 MAG: hypothetical protein A2V21_301125 [Deltaproteobacteria bacterium GWC2_55_46]HBG46011.1 hypothetical protein [Deltaproteobacteria bacterium]HCY11771.1 hypothetical protein [Deltaproteobacteria bacterium]